VNPPARQKYLILTCDSEALPNAAADHHMQRLMWGHFPDAPYDAGIGKLMDIAEEFGAKIVFFHDVMECLLYGEETKRAAGCILERGHELQLHIHVEFLPERFWENLGFKPPRWAMNLYDDITAQFVLEYGIEMFRQMAGSKPLAYRAGAFRYNASVIRALGKCGVPLSFQYEPSSALKPSFPHGFDAGILPVFRWSNGVVEVPVGVYENPHPRRGLPRYKTFELQELLGGIQQARVMMEHFWHRGPEYNVYVLLLHSWSLLHRDASNHCVWKDDSRVRLFRELLANLPSDVRVISATELQRLITMRDLVPAFDLPLQVAGTEGIPLARFNRPDEGPPPSPTVGVKALT
jgi:hypothetical protein